MIFQDIGAVIALALGPYICGQIWGWNESFLLKIIVINACGVYLGVYFSDELLYGDSPEKLGILLTGLLWFGIGYMNGRKCKRYLRVMGWQGYVFKAGAVTFSVGVGQFVCALVRLCIPWLFDLHGRYESFVAMCAHLQVVVITFMLVAPYYRESTDVVKRVARRNIRILVLLWTAVVFMLNLRSGDVVLRLLWWVPGPAVPFAYEIFCCYPIALLFGFPLFESGEEYSVRDEGSEELSEDGELGSVGGKLASMAEQHGPKMVYGQHGYPLKGTIKFDVQLPRDWHAGKLRRNAFRIWQNFRPPNKWPAFVSLSVYAFAPDKVREELREEFGDKAKEVREHPIFDSNRRHELLLHTAEVWLRARGASIYEKHCGTMHGVPSVECVFKRPMMKRLMWLQGLLKMHGYAAVFIIEDYEVVFLFESDFEVFERFLPVVKKIVQELVFTIE